MEVLLLTTLFSVVFAVFFLALFVRDRQTRRFGGTEREALLPFDDEGPMQKSGDKSEILNDTEKTQDAGSSTEETSV